MNRVLSKSTLPGQKSSRVTSNTTIGHSTNPQTETRTMHSILSAFGILVQFAAKGHTLQNIDRLCSKLLFVQKNFATIAVPYYKYCVQMQF